MAKLGPVNNSTTYIYMALDRFAAYILANIFKITPVLLSKMAPKNGLKNVPKMQFFVVLKSSSFPPKKVKNVALTRKSRQQTGLKAIWHIYIYADAHRFWT